MMGKNFHACPEPPVATCKPWILGCGAMMKSEDEVCESLWVETI